MVPVIIGVILIILILILVIARGRSSGATIEDRLAEMTANNQAVSLEELELSQPFYQRVIVPAAEAFGKFAQRFTPQATLEEARHKLELAGLTHKVKPAQFSGYRVVAAIVLGGASFLLLFVPTIPIMQRILIIGVAFILGYMSPSFWLGQKIKKRQDEIIKALPDAMDLLTICVEAGLGFDSALQKVANKWENELSWAFARTVQEMQLGKLRREAMRDMADGMDVPDMTTFVAAIVQADKLGVSMARVMRIQSDAMRQKRRQRAEEKARQAPVKLMFPLVFFIFPTILIMLLGPAFLQIQSSGALGAF